MIGFWPIGNVDSTIELVEIATRESRRLVGHELAKYWRWVFHLTAEHLPAGGLTAHCDCGASMWASNSGILQRWPQGGVQQVAFSPDGTRLAAAIGDGAGGSVSLWETSNSRHAPSCRCHPLTPSPSGRGLGWAVNNLNRLLVGLLRV